MSSMTSGKWKSYLFMGVVCLLVVGCKQQTPKETTEPVAEKQEAHEAHEGHEALESAHGQAADPHQMGATAPAPKIPKKVVVSEEVKNKWESVKLAVKDKSSGASTSYEVAPNSEFEIPQSTIKVTIGAFMPDFTMDAETFTSLSAEPNNPALQVSISEGGEEKYSGWLFSRYPEMHAFEHEKYGITLEDTFSAGGAAEEKI